MRSPRAPDILVVEAQSESLSNLVQAVDVARNTPGVAAVSMSWGFNESAERDRVRLAFPHAGRASGHHVRRIQRRQRHGQRPRIPVRIAARAGGRRHDAGDLDDAGRLPGGDRLVGQRRWLQPL